MSSHPVGMGHVAICMNHYSVLETSVHSKYFDLCTNRARVPFRVYISNKQHIYSIWIYNDKQAFPIGMTGYIALDS